MTDLQALLQTIEHLSPEEFEQVRRVVQEREQHSTIRRAKGTPEERIAGLRAALEAFREGISDEEMADIAQAMNAEYIDPNAFKADDEANEESSEDEL